MTQIDQLALPSTEVRSLGQMTQAGVQWEVQHLLLFYNYVLVNGQFRHPASRLAGVFLAYDNRLQQPGQIIQGTGAHDEQPWTSFVLSGLVPPGFDPEQSSLAFQFMDGSLYVVGWNEIRQRQEELRKEMAGGRSSDKAYSRFFDLLEQGGARSVLEIGSRARSQVTRRELFAGMDYLGMDILDGENVDVVGDAHELSNVVQGREFDAVFCCATFEHLLMPWKVALEINKVLRPGGACYISTHQSLGMHDLPWDYWRYSDTAWHGLFNRFTGFEIVDTYLGELMHLVPFEYHGHWKGCEGSAGFSVSSVVCRKKGPSELSWEVPAAEIAIGEYPA